MQAILNFFGGAAKITTWFLTAVVIPIVAWATIMKTDIESLKKDIASEHQMLIDHKKQYAEDQKETASMLRELKYMVGRIEGKIDRK
jgi:Tfp pilus assembly protein PilO